MRIRAQPSDNYPDGICGICFESLNAFGLRDAVVCKCCSITVHLVREILSAGVYVNVYLWIRERNERECV